MPLSAVNTLPSFLPQLQHLPAAEGKGEAAYLHRMLTGTGSGRVDTGLREATAVPSAALTTQEPAGPAEECSGGAQHSCLQRHVGWVPLHVHQVPCVLSVEFGGLVFV